MADWAGQASPSHTVWSPTSPCSRNMCTSLLSARWTLRACPDPLAHLPPCLLPPTASLPVLPAQQRMGPAEDFALIPPLRSEGGDGWGFPTFPTAGNNGGRKFTGGQSALLGDFRPVQAPTPAAAATTRCDWVGGQF